MFLKELLIRLLFPVSCIYCGKWGIAICLDCLENLPIVEYQKCVQCGKHSAYGLTHPKCKKKYGLHGCFSLFLYSGKTKKVIKKIKYAGEYTLIKDIFSGISTKRIKDSIRYFIHPSESILILPVPLHSSRKLQRGFNQAELIALMISECTGYPVWKNILRRLKNTEAQAKVHTLNLREKNVINAFFCDTIRPNRHAVILVDDVWSSGATLRSCAHAIKKNNPHVKVYGWTLAEGQ
jgi:ComF family protein